MIKKEINNLEVPKTSSAAKNFGYFENKLEIRNMSSSKEILEFAKNNDIVHGNDVNIFDNLYQEFDDKLYPENKIRDAKNRMLHDEMSAMKFMEFLSKENIPILDKNGCVIKEFSFVKIDSKNYMLYNSKGRGQDDI